MDPRPSLELLDSSHTFPGPYQIKAIGAAADDFEGRVLDRVRAEIASPGDLAHSARSTPDGKHISITLDIQARSAEEVRAIYARLQEIEGLRFLL